MESPKSSQGQARPSAEKMESSSFLQTIQTDAATFSFFVGVLVGILTLIFLYVWSRKGTRRRTVLLTGTCEAGKTAIFARLLHGQEIETYTSVKENGGIFIPQGKGAVRIVDVPGHERVRQKHVDKLKSSAMAVVYVVDSSTINKQLRDTAEFLFNLLSDPELNAARLPLLVACNKQDLDFAKGSEIIQRELEREIQLLRGTHSRSLQGTDDSVSRQVYLGRSDSDFKFDDLSFPVQFLETSVKDDSGLDKLKDWLQQVA